MTDGDAQRRVDWELWVFWDISHVRAGAFLDTVGGIGGIVAVRGEAKGDTGSAGLVIAPCRPPSGHCTTPMARMMRSLPPWTDGSLHHSLRSSASAPLAPRSSASPSIASAASSISARRSSWNA